MTRSSSPRRRPGLVGFRSTTGRRHQTSTRTSLVRFVSVRSADGGRGTVAEAARTPVRGFGRASPTLLPVRNCPRSLGSSRALQIMARNIERVPSAERTENESHQAVHFLCNIARRCEFTGPQCSAAFARASAGLVTSRCRSASKLRRPRRPGAPAPVQHTVDDDPSGEGLLHVTPHKDLLTVNRKSSRPTPP